MRVAIDPGHRRGSRTRQDQTDKINTKAGRRCPLSIVPAQLPAGALNDHSAGYCGLSLANRILFRLAGVAWQFSPKSLVNRMFHSGSALTTDSFPSTSTR
jgi:hypothetical protein